MDLIPVSIDQIPIGQPLPWPLYDKDGHVMFYDGEEISAQQIQLLASVLAEGLFRQSGAAAPGAAAKAPEESVDRWVQEQAEATATAAELFPPAGIKPQVGERLQIRVGGSKTQYISRLVGYIKGHSIIVTTPAWRGQRAEFLDGEAVEVRMLTGGDIYLFRSAVLQSCVSPTHYVHLEYPTKVSRQKLRRHPWASVDINVAVVTGDGKRENGKITNLSGSGAKIAIPQPLGGEREAIRLDFPVSIDEIHTELSLDAIVRRSGEKELRHGLKLMEYGVEFSNVTPDKALWLRCLVFERIAKGHTT